MRHPRRAAAIFLAAMGAAAPTHAQSPAEPDIAAGKKIAVDICSVCHVVSDDQQFPPLLRNPAPSFATIANRRSATAQSLRTFISTAHATVQHPAGMPNPQLTEEQTKDVVAYLMTLRARH